jgi:hypothetical protein
MKKNALYKIYEKKQNLINKLNEFDDDVTPDFVNLVFATVQK